MPFDNTPRTPTSFLAGTIMRHLSLVALFAAACVRTDVAVLSPNQYAPVPPDSVRVFLTLDDVLGEYERMALMDAYEEGECSGFGFCPGREDMIQALRERAGALGATGLVLDVRGLTGLQESRPGETGVRGERGVSALAIRDLNPNLDRSDVVVLSPRTYEPVSADAVRVFLGYFEVPENHEEIALIDVYEVATCTASGCPHASEVVQLLKRKAGEVGADGIIIEGDLPEIREVRRTETAFRVMAIRTNASGAPTDAGGATAEISRIAVLPLRNVLDNPEQEYFAEGMTEALITDLAKIGALTVMSRSSVMRFQGTDQTLQEIARRLNVDAVIEGSVLLVGDRVRISAHLIDAGTERHLWAESYERHFSDLLNLQSEVAQTIAREIEISLTPQDETRLASTARVDPLAYDYYLRGNVHFARRLAEEDARLAVEMYQRAVDADSTFPEAFARLAHARAWLAWDWEGPEEVAKAREAMDRALELAPNRAEVQLAAGYFSYYGDVDYSAALEQFNTVLEWQPNNAEVLTAIGLIHRRQGNWNGAIERLVDALELSPQDHFVAFVIGQTYGAMRRYDDAERYINRAIAIAPTFLEGHVEKAWLYTHQYGSTERGWQALREASSYIDSTSLAPARMGFYIMDRRFDLALESSAIAPTREGSERPTWFVHYLARQQAAVNQYAESARRIYGPLVTERPLEPQLHSYLGAALAALGDADGALQSGRQAVQLRPVSIDAFTGPTMIWNLAVIHLLLGQHGDAIEQLTALAEVPSRLELPPLSLDPTWDRLRDDPRFQRLLERRD
jgi:TolB-like protein/Flp pilus assembly protein TadD